MLLRSLERKLSKAAEVRVGQPVPDQLSDNLLMEMVMTQDGVADEVYDRHRADYIHVSSLLTFCSRRHVLSVKDEIQLLRQPRGADRIVWEMGRAVERHIRGQIIGRLNYVGVTGIWHCPCRSLEYGGSFEEGRLCPRCHFPAFVYGELVLVDDDAKIIGHPDLILQVGTRELIVEIKSMNKKDFDALTEPKADHVFQGSCYHKMRGAATRVHPQVAILYACKDYAFSLPYKEFHIDVTQGMWPTLLDKAWEKAHEVKDALAQGRTPCRLDQCETSLSTTAKNCLACVSCFNRQDCMERQ